MERSWFRLSVSLKHFFSDERTQCYVSVEGHRPVRWLRLRLMRLFGSALSAAHPGAAIALTCRGHLLLDDEPLALLDQDDVIMVVPVQFAIPSERDDLEEFISSRDYVTASKAGNIQANGSKNNYYNNDISCGKILTKISSPKEVHFDCVVKDRFEKFAETKVSNQSDNLDSLSNLHNVKERALYLLDQYCQMDNEARICPKRKRRRVRKRRQPQDQTEQIECDSSHSEGTLEEGQEVRGSPAEPVARNINLEARSARLIQPINTNTVVQ